MAILKSLQSGGAARSKAAGLSLRLGAKSVGEPGRENPRRANNRRCQSSSLKHQLRGNTAENTHTCSIPRKYSHRHPVLSDMCRCHKLRSSDNTSFTAIFTQSKVASSSWSHSKQIVCSWLTPHSQHGLLENSPFNFGIKKKTKRHQPSYATI